MLCRRGPRGVIIFDPLVSLTKLWCMTLWTSCCLKITTIYNIQNKAWQGGRIWEFMSDGENRSQRPSLHIWGLPWWEYFHCNDQCHPATVEGSSYSTVEGSSHSQGHKQTYFSFNLQTWKLEWPTTTIILSCCINDIIIIILYFENVAFFHAKMGSDVCPRVDNQTSGDTLQDSTQPLVEKSPSSQLSTHGYLSEFLVVGCSFTPTISIWEETLESGNLLSGSWISASVP